MSIHKRPAIVLALAVVAAVLAGCQTQSTRDYGPHETWPSREASLSNRGGD